MNKLKLIDLYVSTLLLAAFDYSGQWPSPACGCDATWWRLWSHKLLYSLFGVRLHSQHTLNSQINAITAHAHTHLLSLSTAISLIRFCGSFQVKLIYLYKLLRVLCANHLGELQMHLIHAISFGMGHSIPTQAIIQSFLNSWIRIRNWWLTLAILTQTIMKVI